MHTLVYNRDFSIVVLCNVLMFVFARMLHRVCPEQQHGLILLWGPPKLLSCIPAVIQACDSDSACHATKTASAIVFVMQPGCLMHTLSCRVQTNMHVRVARHSRS